MSVRPNILLVEGEADKRVIPELIEANGVPWSKPHPVHIEPYGGFPKMLPEIGTWLKTGGLKALGILVDADDDAHSRWLQVRARCQGGFSDLPDQIPADGLIATNDDGLRLGVWLMPDNQNRGMLETFLAFLRPTDNPPLLTHTKQAYTQARTLGAPCKPTHEDKALIHTWLAWQDPPGRQLHQAIIERILDPASPHAVSFVGWFKTLYAL